VGLKVLCAGCGADAREAAEKTVRDALETRAQQGNWTVSLVRLGAQWSVTLDAPDAGLRATFMAPGDRLGDAIAENVGRPSPSSQPASSEPRNDAPEPAGAWKCEKCHGAFVVTYEKVPGESQVNVAVACPRCWHINHVPVGESAAGSQDYRAVEA
jgi:hypothetical protein